MNSIHTNLRSVALVLAATLLASSASMAANRAVTIKLNPDSMIESETVRIGDVATLDGGSHLARKHFGAFVLADGLQPGESATIRSKQIAFRLRLAGVGRESFHVVGDTVTVKRTGVTSLPTAPSSSQESATTAIKPPTEPTPTVFASTTEPQPPWSNESLRTAVLREARALIQRRLPWDSRNIEIQLAHPLDGVEAVKAKPDDELTFHSRLKSPWPPLGRVLVGVNVQRETGRDVELPVILIVEHFEEVVVTKKQVERGQILKADNVYFDRRNVSHLRSYFTSSDDVIGRAAKTLVRPLQVVEESHVAPPESTEADNPVLVKKNDRVRLVVRAAGVVSISVTGEAMENGRNGDMIRIRNVDSDSVVLGRVVSRDQVEVPL